MLRLDWKLLRQDPLLFLLQFFDEAPQSLTSQLVFRLFSWWVMCQSPSRLLREWKSFFMSPSLRGDQHLLLDFGCCKFLVTY